MASKTDNFTAALYLGITVLVFLLAHFLGSGRFPAYILDIEAIIFNLYPALWAISIRRALAGPLYKQQALGTSAFCVGLLLHAISHGGLISGDAGAFTLLLLVVFILYLVDTSARAGRRSDPFLRDTLSWSKIRRPIWVIVLILVIPQLVEMIITGTYSVPSGLFAAGFVATLILVSGLGISLLFFIAKRSGDYTLRRHLSWLGLAVLATFATALVGGFLGFLTGASFAIGRAVAGYLLYKSSKSLVPLNEIPSESDAPNRSAMVE